MFEKMEEKDFIKDFKKIQKKHNKVRVVLDCGFITPTSYFIYLDYPDMKNSKKTVLFYGYNYAIGCFKLEKIIKLDGGANL
jgi:hypothetical protein